MKAKFLLAASFILAIGMTGCSKSNDEENPVPDKTNNVLLVTLPDNVKSTRGVEPSAEGHMTNLQNVTVFLLNGYIVEKVVEFKMDDIAARYLRIEQVSSSVDYVMVIANNTGKYIFDLKNMDEIRNFPFTVETQHVDTRLNDITLMGEANVYDSPDPGPSVDGHLFKQADVDLKAITARLEIGDVVPGVGVADVDLIAVYLNNVYNHYPQSQLIFHTEDEPCWKVDVTQDPGANFGSKDPIVVTGLQPYDPSQYMTRANPLVKPEAGSEVYAYHVFPGNIPHLILLVKLELLDGYYELDHLGNPLKYKYGFVTFTKFSSGNGYVDALVPHNIYKMGVGATGIKINAKDVTDKPDKSAYDLGIQVDIQPWDVQIVTPEI